MIIFIAVACIGCGLFMTIRRAMGHSETLLAQFFGGSRTPATPSQPAHTTTVPSAWTTLDDVQLVRLLKDAQEDQE